MPIRASMVIFATVLSMHRPETQWKTANPSYTDLQKLLASTQGHGDRSVREQAPAH